MRRAAPRAVATHPADRDRSGRRSRPRGYTVPAWRRVTVGEILSNIATQRCITPPKVAECMKRAGLYTTEAEMQVFDEDGLIGRAFSSSYVPPQGTEEGKKFLTLLKDLFSRCNIDGKVSFHYQTEIYLGEV